MIECRINGHKTYPSLSQGLKIVIENPAMRDKNSYTYDMVFPLDIPQNARFFSHVGHLSVSVKEREYQNCSLILDNKVLFSGKGIVTNVSQSEVKMQIVEETASSFPDVFKEMYIDKISYPPVDSRFIQAEFDDGGEFFYNNDHGMIRWYNPSSDLTNNKFIGERYKYTFVTTVPDGEENQTGEAVEDLVNVICVARDGGWVVTALYRLAVQPNLMYILRKVLEAGGYTCDISSIDIEPWKDLYIASALKTLNIAEALPHWTAEKFLEEIEKLFNVSFSWEGNRATARKIWENDASLIISLSTESEFERNYDEEGQEYSDTSNLTYKLSETHDGLETIERGAIEKFGIKKFATESIMRNTVAGMTEKEKKTSFFSTPETPELYYWHESTGEDDEDRLEKAGLFRPLYRDLTADNEKPLHIIPVAIESEIIDTYAFIHSRGYNNKYYLEGGLGSPLPRPVLVKNKITEDYITTQDMVEDGSSDDTKEDESVMEIMFVGPNHCVNDFVIGSAHTSGDIPRNLAKVSDYIYRVGLKAASLSLNECNGMKCIGEMHVSQMQIDKSSGFNKYEETIVKFIRDDIPPINNIFLIQNKRYLAKQLEIQLTENGFSKDITGHFYELDT